MLAMDVMFGAMAVIAIAELIIIIRLKLGLAGLKEILNHYMDKYGKPSTEVVDRCSRKAVFKLFPFLKKTDDSTNITK